MEFKDYYTIMGVARDASQDEIKRAYRSLARKYHPDVSKLPDAEVRFKELGEAYAVLKDLEKRAAYDELGSNWKAGQDFRPPPGGNGGFEFSGAGGDGADASAISSSPSSGGTKAPDSTAGPGITRAGRTTTPRSGLIWRTPTTVPLVRLPCRPPS